MKALLPVALLLAAGPALAVDEDLARKAAQGVEKFVGEVKLDKGKARPPRKLVLLDASGVAVRDFDQALLAQLTEQAVQEFTAGLRQRGYEVIAGEPVVAAFRQIPGVAPDEEALQKLLMEKWHLKPEDAKKQVAALQARNEQAVEKGAKSGPGDRTYRAQGTVYLESLLVKGEGRKLEDYASPSARDVQKRIAALNEALGADGAIVVRFDLDRTHPGPVGPKGGGLFGAITAVKDSMNALKGDRAAAGLELAVYGRDGKDEIVEVSGGVRTREGGGVNTKRHELAGLVPAAMEGLVASVLHELDERLD